MRDANDARVLIVNRVLAAALGLVAAFGSPLLVATSEPNLLALVLYLAFVTLAFATLVFLLMLQYAAAQVPSLDTMQAPTGSSGVQTVPNRGQSNGDTLPLRISPQQQPGCSRAGGTSTGSILSAS